MDQNSINTNVNEPNLLKLNVTWKHTLIVWWAYYWKNTLALILLEKIANLLLGYKISPLLGTSINFPVDWMERTHQMRLISFTHMIVSICISISLIKHVFLKKYKEFSLALTSTLKSSVEKVDITWRRIVQIWWSYAWRQSAAAILFVIIYMITLSEAKALSFMGSSIYNIPFILGIMLSTLIFRVILAIKYKYFEVTLLGDEKK